MTNEESDNMNDNQRAQNKLQKTIKGKFQGQVTSVSDCNCSVRLIPDKWTWLELMEDDYGGHHC